MLVQGLPPEGASAIRYALGPGRDRLTIDALSGLDSFAGDTKLRIDLGRHEIAIGRYETDGVVRGIEVLDVAATVLTVTGSRGPDGHPSRRMRRPGARRRGAASTG